MRISDWSSDVCSSDLLGVEKQLRSLAGVRDARANPASESVTVDYDEGVTDPASLRSMILDCGYHCRGRTVPRHVCALDRRVVADDRAEPERAPPDRKSTRLNSSH